MDIQQLSIKLMAHPQADGERFDQDPLIAIFHRWIREHRLGKDVLLIDVADYRHVPEGPGIMLIGNDAHWHLDEGQGQLGLRYARKRDPLAPVGQRVKEAMAALVTAAVALEDEPTLGGQLTFDPGRLEVHVMSRLVAPNNAETYDGFQPELAAALSALYGEGASLSYRHLDDARAPFGVEVTVEGAPDLKTLQKRL